MGTLLRTTECGGGVKDPKRPQWGNGDPTEDQGMWWGREGPQETAVGQRGPYWGPGNVVGAWRTPSDHSGATGTLLETGERGWGMEDPK